MSATIEDSVLEHIRNLGALYEEERKSAGAAVDQETLEEFTRGCQTDEERLSALVKACAQTQEQMERLAQEYVEGTETLLTDLDEELSVFVAEE